jgi:hypothetical protein
MSESFLDDTQNNAPLGEVVEINNARFLDHLDTEYEDAWAELIELGKEIGSCIEDLMVPVWSDESLPAVFRDRAMLMIAGSVEAKKHLSEKSFSTNGGFAFFGVSLEVFEKQFEGFDAGMFCRWVQEAWQKQHETGEDLIKGEHILRLQYEFYKRGLITEEYLDDFVDQIDPLAYSPVLSEVGWGIDDAYELDKDRFPFLVDVFDFRTISARDTKVRDWAFKQLQRWLSYQTQELTELPEWLKNVSESRGYAVYANLINGGSKPEWVSWDALKPAIEHFGLSFFNDHYNEPTLSSIYKVSDKSLKEEILKEILLCQKRRDDEGKPYRMLSCGSVSMGPGHSTISLKDIVEAVIRETDDEELIELYAADKVCEEGYLRRSEADRQRRIKERRREVEQTPEYMSKMKAKEAFLGRVALLRTS